ncbi:MAG: hypothetical protein ACYC0C_02115 [Devosia sp.]
MALELNPWYVADPLTRLLIVDLGAAVGKPFGALGDFIDVARQRLVATGSRDSRLPARGHGGTMKGIER